MPMLSGNPFKVGPQVVLWILAAVVFCGSSFLGIAGALALLQSRPFWGSDNLFYTSICAAIAWIFVAVFLFGKETIYLPLTHPATFLGIARRVLEEMGYEVAGHSCDSLSTRRGFQLMLFGLGIQIKCADRQARISGPKIWVEALRRRLRVQSFLDATDPSICDGAQKGGVLLKRVQIQMRVSPENLEKVSRHVLQRLAQEAAVICEVNLLAQSDAGIREGTVELEIRPWLAEQGISAEIHKDLAKMPDLNATMILPGNRRRKLNVS